MNISNTNSLSISYETQAMEKPGAVVEMREQQKNDKYKETLAKRNINFIPFIMEINGGYSSQAQEFFSMITQSVKDKLNIDDVSAVISNFKNCISFIQRKSYIQKMFEVIREN